MRKVSIRPLVVQIYMVCSIIRRPLPAVRLALKSIAVPRFRCRVLDKHFEPIDGLYAAGEAAGMAGG
ncbi:MAG: FAD-binding protein, partial [Rhodospirillaceae bacterium]|nr:FAD-binding protein [Rhodospirillaceae bacterium]